MNYQLLMDEILVDEENVGKKLLLHSCCAPCSSYPLLYLAEYFAITVLYYNPNIFPKEEFFRRMDEQKRFIGSITTRFPIVFVPTVYNEGEFNNAVLGLEDEPEGCKRCYACYKLRMEYGAKYAAENGFDFFTTTLSISPHKNADYLNEIGFSLAKKYSVNYLPSDFKKRDGYKKSIALSKQYNLYRQDYCGCQYSMRWKNE